MLPEQAKELIRQGKYAEKLSRIYVCGEEEAAERGERIVRAIDEFGRLYGAERDVMIFSAPGRTEIGGNHTDHQGGRVLAAGVNLDAVAVAAPLENGEIRVRSQGFPEDAINIKDLFAHPEEKNTSKALLRGICADLIRRGSRLGGFCAYTTSEVLPGSGLSSSAAFEVLIGTVLNGMFCDGSVPPLVVAQVGQHAENNYFGKPCGLMDQAACAIGGFAMLDFRDAFDPKAEKIPFNFSTCGYRLCMIDTKGNHAALTPDYAAIPAEMKAVAKVFGKEILSQVDEAEFFANIAKVRAAAGDRAVLRAIHYFGENARVLRESEALKAGDFDGFRNLVIESGRSSFEYLQNVFSPSHVAEQGVAVALALCERLLTPCGGAWRVHGGGFAGTVQAYVPERFLPEFTKRMEAVFGEKSCLPLSVRPVGGIRIL